MDVVGNYSLNIEVGGTPTAIPPQMIRELTITEDLERLLPTFKMTLKDATKLLSDVAPYDNNSNAIRVEFARGIDTTDLNTFDFLVKRRQALSPEEVYSVEGLLDVPSILTDYKKRALIGNIKTSLETIARDEMKIATTQIGSSLNYEKSILQPNWTTSKLLRYLRKNLVGRGGEAGYYTFVMVQRGDQIFVMKSLDELLQTSVQYRFIIGHRGHQEFYPVSQYRIFDNSPMISDLGGKVQSYQYFDWDTGTYKDGSVEIDDCPSLSEFFLIDKSNNTDSILYTNTGRSNDFTSDFDGRVRNDYYRRLNSNIVMWMSTWGLENISPGDIVQVVFSEALERDNLFLYQHTGLWMVKRVVHILGMSYMTNLELIRCGVDTDISTSLLEATKRVV